MSGASRLKDLADVQELIKIKGLTVAFADGLDPSVRQKYLELHRGVELAKRQVGTG
jgi:hypothetical protein